MLLAWNRDVLRRSVVDPLLRKRYVKLFTTPEIKGTRGVSRGLDRHPSDTSRSGPVDLELSDRLGRLQASRGATLEELGWVYFWREWE